MLFGATLPNALRQLHAHESDHLQSLFLQTIWALCITAFKIIEFISDFKAKKNTQFILSKAEGFLTMTFKEHCEIPNDFGSIYTKICLNVLGTV